MISRTLLECTHGFNFHLSSLSVMGMVPQFLAPTKLGIIVSCYYIPSFNFLNDGRIQKEDGSKAKQRTSDKVLHDSLCFVRSKSVMIVLTVRELD